MTKGKGIKPEEMIPPATPIRKYTPQEFSAEYGALCKRMGFQIVGQAGLKPMNDLGGYMTVVQLAIVPYVEPAKAE